MENDISMKSSLFNSKAEYVVSGLELFAILTVTAFQTHTMIFASSANNMAVRAELAPAEVRRWPTVAQMKAN